VKEKFSVSREAPLQFGRFALLPIMELKPDPSNPRKHGREQIRAIARSIAAFGFNAPILIDRNKQIVAGHGRYEAAKLNQCAEVPVVWLEHLSETQARAYMLADNKFTDRSSWDDAALAVHLKELSELVLDFDIEDIGFELPEIDFRIQSLDAVDDADLADEFQLFPGFAVSRPSDLWLLGYHRLYCGSALETTAYDVLLDGAKAATVFTDPPYNVKIDGHACGSGAIKHREFAMASGEMTSQTFERFLAEALVESEKFREQYATLPNIIKAKDMPWERSPDGLIKHLVNQKMHTRECCIEAYMQFLKDGERSGKHRHMWEELFFVVEGSGYDLHWDLKWDCLEAFDWQWAETPKKFEWSVGDYVYIPPFTMHQHFAKPGEECRIIVMSNRIVKDMGFDWYDQVERAAGF